jgi:hypothetical protein
MTRIQRYSSVDKLKCLVILLVLICEHRSGDENVCLRSLRPRGIDLKALKRKTNNGDMPE